MTRYEWVKEVDTTALQAQRDQKEAALNASIDAAFESESARREREYKEAEEEAKRDAIQAEIDRAERYAVAKEISAQRVKTNAEAALWLACFDMTHDDRIELFELLCATRNQYFVFKAEANAK
jgi:spore coat polysaccharide biosynthesis protein SpsF (cytidylyltransferase family)